MNVRGSSPRFIADDMLGRLAKWLRIIGYDASYYPAIRDIDLVNQALRENRIILTRDGELIKRKLVRNYVFIKGDHYLAQLSQVVQKLRLEVSPERFFTRCLHCNRLIERAAKAEVEGRVPPYVYRTQGSFYRCPGCKRIYWTGTHIEHVKDKLKEVK